MNCIYWLYRLSAECGTGPTVADSEDSFWSWSSTICFYIWRQHSCCYNKSWSSWSVAQLVQFLPRDAL